MKILGKSDCYFYKLKKIEYKQKINGFLAEIREKNCVSIKIKSFEVWEFFLLKVFSNQGSSFFI